MVPPSRAGWWRGRRLFSGAEGDPELTFARVHTLETTSEQHDQGLAAVIEEIMPWLRESTGFRGLIRLANAETGKVLAITLWATEQDLDDSAEAAKRLTELTATGIGASWISVENFEVSLFDVAP